MKHFFISYNKADRAWAEWIGWQLEEGGYTTVLQAWDFRPGANFVLEMQRAAVEAERTVAVLSPDYLAARFTQPEWAAAFAQDPTGEKGTLLPVRVRECDLKGLLPQIIYIDLMGLGEEQAKEKLLAGVKRGRAKPATAPDFPGAAPRSVPTRPRFPGALPSIWNVPHRRNPNFTGREALLESLRTALTSGQADRGAAHDLAEALGDLPLALEQAGAYVEAAGISLSDYLDLFRRRSRDLFRRGAPSADYPATVATTWELAFQQVRQASPAGADLLNLCAFLSPDDIPRSLFTEGAEHLPGSLKAAAADSLAFADSLAALRRFSLIEVRDETLSVHRLVQTVARDRLAEEDRRTWAGAAVSLVNGAFPYDSDDVRTWPACSRLLSHALTASEHAEGLKVAPEATGRLLNQVGLYLRGRAEYARARAAFERALSIDEATTVPTILTWRASSTTWAMSFRLWAIFPVRGRLLSVRSASFASS